jgi:hypothetical protein
MATARQRDQWRRRMITLHCKAIRLCEDIKAVDGECGLWEEAMEVSIAAAQGVTIFGGYDHEREPAHD